MNKYLQFGLIVIVVAILVVILTKLPLKQPKIQNPLLNVEVSLGDLPPLGNSSAGIKIVEFGDFLCPFCARAVIDLYPRLENLIQEGKIAIYFRDFVVHPEAMPIHNAARCANEQNKYWEFNKEIYKKFMSGENIIKKEVWLNLAQDLNLNLENFEKCIDENRYFASIQKDIEEGLKAGVEGTPTFFINNKKIVGINIPEIMSTINNLLK